MSDTVRAVKRRSLEQRLAALTDEHDAVSRQLTSTLDPSAEVRLKRQLANLEAEMAQVEADLRALDGAPSVAPAPAGPLVTDRVALRKALIDHFRLEELKTLCFGLGVDFENIAGESKSGKALELVQYFERRGRLEQLAAKIREERPNAGI